MLGLIKNLWICDLGVVSFCIKGWPSAYGDYCGLNVKYSPHNPELESWDPI